MRVLFISILFAVIVQPIKAEVMADLVWIEGQFYQKFSSKPFTGRITGQPPSSLFDQRMEGMMKDGKRDGLWVVYCTNGRLSHKGYYVGGAQHGESLSYYCTGHLMEKCTYKLGKRHGACSNAISLSWVRYGPATQLLKQAARLKPLVQFDSYEKLPYP